MLQSMTGFGKASATFEGKKITAEIKSLNSKQFDLNIKMPSLYREKELVLRSHLSNLLGRGKVELSIYTESGEAEKRVTINQHLASLYLDQVKLLQEKTALPMPNNMLSSLLGMPEVLQTERPELSEPEWNAVEEAINKAVENLLEFRNAEGEELAKDIESRINEIEKLRNEIDQHLPERLEKVRERIEKNVAEFLSSEKTDQNRMEQEIVFYLEKLDITEEHIRLQSHCNYFLETMHSPEQAGKKLGFISQEMGREINTMGSKANYVPIQKLVVQMKDELEKIKEQLLNIR